MGTHGAYHRNVMSAFFVVRGSMDRKQQFLMLVQTACIGYDLCSITAGERNVRAVWVLADALRVDPECIPPDLETAVWAFVDHHYKGTDRPAWLEYLPEDER